MSFDLEILGRSAIDVSVVASSSPPCPNPCLNSPHMEC
jgi:hypothetical protein